jgi:hypothetical protein
MKSTKKNWIEIACLYKPSVLGGVEMFAWWRLTGGWIEKETSVDEEEAINTVV